MIGISSHLRMAVSMTLVAGAVALTGCGPAPVTRTTTTTEQITTTPPPPVSSTTTTTERTMRMP